jgi:uncharacterized protein (DUF433 family)
VTDSSTRPLTDDELIERYIEPGSTRRDRARVREQGVPVWALIGYLRVSGDEAGVAHDYAISDEAMRAALAFFRRNREVIDARLTLNNAQ